MKQVRVLRIVVASPSDVQAERDMIPAIVDELNKGIADERGVRLEVYRWETDAYPAFHPQGPQGQIDSCLRIEDCDLLIAIFWKRFGTPVLDAQSGTEHEIRLALESCEKLGRPQLMIYFNQAPHEPRSQAEKDQWQQVLDFKQTLSQKVLWWEYNSKDQFRYFVRQHLTQFIRGDYSGRPLDELLQAYRDHLTHRVGTVRIFGEAEPRPLEKVFVELTLTEEYDRPTVNAQWLGMMDAELRRRRDIFARDDEEDKKQKPNDKSQKVKRTLRPDELLRKRTQAVIVGAPGCGKTTLLRYLALKTLQASKRFPVFFELKSLSEKVFEAVEGHLVELLFAKAVAAPLGLSAAEAERCKAFFLARLKAGEVTIFLDGLDEVAGAKFFSALCRSVNDFMASAYRHNDLIISTRPYALQHRFEGMQEMEIEALNPGQIEAFLQHYYGDDPTTKSLQQELRRRRELQEMARAPFLLSLIAYLYRQQGEILGERLELYRQLVQQLVTQLDREKNVERFYLPDPDGLLKRDFLKQLAYERLFVDAVDQDAERLILTGEVIAAKARMYCQMYHVTSPHLLAADVKATPLLREIGADTYAFSHLTLQEYFAAVALAEQPDCEKIFCRAYFNPTLAEMEVLPMTLGLVRKPDDFYVVLEELPESLNFANLRLQARGLAYVRHINPEYPNRLKFDFINTQIRPGGMPYQDAITNSFEASDEFSTLFVDLFVIIMSHGKDWCVRVGADGILGEINSKHSIGDLPSALKDKDDDIRANAGETPSKIDNDQSIEELPLALNDEVSGAQSRTTVALDEIGGEHSVVDLMLTLNDKDRNMRQGIAEALGTVGSTRSVDASVLYLDASMLSLKDEDRWVWSAAKALGEINSELSAKALALNDEKVDVRENVLEALGNIRNEHSIEALVLALKDWDGNIHAKAAEVLAGIGNERSIEALLLALKDENKYVRMHAAEVLGRINNERSVDALLLALKDNVSEVRRRAVVALSKIGNERCVDDLLLALKDENEYVRMNAAEVIGKIGNESSTDNLLVALKDENEYVRMHAAEALGKIRNECSVDGLLLALKDENEHVRMHAAEALGQIGDERSVDDLLLVLNDEVSEVRCRAAAALVKIESKRSVDALLLALKDKDWNVGESAAKALGKMSDMALVNGLTHSLSYDDDFIRQKATQVIGYYTTDKQVLSKLQRVAKKDRSEEVRAAAREAAEKYANKLRYFSQ